MKTQSNEPSFIAFSIYQSDLLNFFQHPSSIILIRKVFPYSFNAKITGAKIEAQAVNKVKVETLFS